MVGIASLIVAIIGTVASITTTVISMAQQARAAEKAAQQQIDHTVEAEATAKEHDESDSRAKGRELARRLAMARGEAEGASAGSGVGGASTTATQSSMFGDIQQDMVLSSIPGAVRRRNESSQRQMMGQLAKQQGEMGVRDAYLTGSSSIINQGFSTGYGVISNWPDSTPADGGGSAKGLAKKPINPWERNFSGPGTSAFSGTP